MNETKLQSLYWKSVRVNDGLFMLEKRMQQSIKKGRDCGHLIQEFLLLTDVLYALKNEMITIERGVF